MSRLGRYTRRGFLVVATAVAGGAAFGVWKAREVPPNPLAPGEGAVALTPWLVIDAAGTTVVVPRAEMGQGVTTTLAAMVAEELDLRWDDVRVIHGPPAQAYFNGALVDGGLPFAAYAMTPRQRWVAEEAAVLPKMLSLQITGGSTSTVDAFVRMRLAGATAREALKRAAADLLQLSTVVLRTSDGAVHAPDGSALPYTALAAAAAAAPLPAAVLRSPAEWKLLGRALPRTDMVAKVTGTATFGVDVALPSMVFATVRMNPRLGGPMRSFDPAPALALPGVERVIDLGTGIAVVAASTWHAFRGAEAVAVDWGPAPYPETTDAIFAGIAAAFDARPNSVLRREGRVPGAAPGDVTAEYRAPYLAHATMEPMNATALREPDALTVWCGTQVPVLARDACARAVGLPADRVTLHTTFLGGGFGRRLETDYAVLAARVADTMPGVPVKVTWSRSEDMRHDVYRPGALARFRGRVEDGRIAVLDARIAAPSVLRQAARRATGFAAPGPDRLLTEGSFDQPYAVANVRIAGHLADVAVPVGYWRSVGNSMNAFFHESFVDELADAAGADPLQFRIDHVGPLHPPSAAVLAAVGEMSGWGGGGAAGTAKGVAFTHSFGTPVAEVVELRDEGGRIRIARAWIACDVGRALDPGIIEAQMVSGLIFGLSAAVLGEITFAGGEVEQQNFPDYDALRMPGTPAVEVRILQGGGRLGGVGEPGTPPAAPALANAVFALTGQRIRELPLGKAVDFVL